MISKKRRSFLKAFSTILAGTAGLGVLSHSANSSDKLVDEESIKNIHAPSTNVTEAPVKGTWWI